jgi:hypothetical protein
MKLITGKSPDLLGIIYFTNKRAFRLYFKYLDQPYEEFLRIHMAEFDPIKRRYSFLCKSCTEKFCTPLKTKERTII